MKTEIRIPKMDAIITCHSKREEKLARILVNNMKDIADAAIGGYKYGLDAVKEFGQSYLYEEMYGMAAAMFHLGMLEAPLSSVEFADACREMYLDKCAFGADVWR